MHEENIIAKISQKNSILLDFCSHFFWLANHFLDEDAVERRIFNAIKLNDMDRNDRERGRERE